MQSWHLSPGCCVLCSPCSFIMPIDFMSCYVQPFFSLLFLCFFFHVCSLLMPAWLSLIPFKHAMRCHCWNPVIMSSPIQPLLNDCTLQSVSSDYLHDFPETSHFSLMLSLRSISLSYTKSQQSQWLTRQLSYRKEDRAMRPIYRCPENFW